VIVTPEEHLAMVAVELATAALDDEAEAERLWAREAQQRLEAYRAGRTIPVPAEQVHAKAEKLMR
jgi:hypothetical protein